jgi:hypothetical protein
VVPLRVSSRFPLKDDRGSENRATARERERASELQDTTPPRRTTHQSDQRAAATTSPQVEEGPLLCGLDCCLGPPERSVEGRCQRTGGREGRGTFAGAETHRADPRVGLGAPCICSRPSAARAKSALDWRVGEEATIVAHGRTHPPSSLSLPLPHTQTHSLSLPHPSKEQ